MSDVLEGEQNTCWRVDDITSEGVVLTLVKATYRIKATYRPWWSDDTVYNVGDYTDTWFTSNDYRNNRPNATTTDQLKGLFTAHSACPKDIS